MWHKIHWIIAVLILSCGLLRLSFYLGYNDGFHDGAVEQQKVDDIEKSLDKLFPKKLPEIPKSQINPSINPIREI